MLSRKATGFTLVEVMVSLAIMGLLAVTVVVNMNSGKRTEELRGAARQMAADIRSMQSRALSAGEVKACVKGGVTVVCENSAADCSTPCTGTVPSIYGVMATTSATGYVLFAKVDGGRVNYWMENSDETMLARRLLQVGSQDVEIQDIQLPGSPPQSRNQASLGFMRQSGTNRIYDGTGTEPSIIDIILRHKISGATQTLEINRVTGRVSIL